MAFPEDFYKKKRGGGGTQNLITSTHDSHPTSHPHPYSHTALCFFLPPHIHDATVPLPSLTPNSVIKLCPVQSAILVNQTLYILNIRKPSLQTPAFPKT